MIISRCGGAEKTVHLLTDEEIDMADRQGKEGEEHVRRKIDEFTEELQNVEIPPRMMELARKLEEALALRAPPRSK